MQLPIPPGLSVYGEPVEEITSNIYESIDLQREYINPYVCLCVGRLYTSRCAFEPARGGGWGGFNWAWLVSKTQTYESIPFVRLAVYGHARCNRRRTTQHYDVYKQPMQQSEHRLAPNVCMTLKAG